MSAVKTDETVYIDPQMGPVIAAMVERMASRSAMSETAPAEMRVRAASDFVYWNENAPALPRVENLTMKGPLGDIRLRFYDPLEQAEPRPALVYFHGGGWVIGDLDMEDASLRQLARASGVAIVSVDYCLAPEHKFPAPVQDCVAAFSWVAEHAADLKLDPERLAIGGGSAGANLAMASTLMLRGQGKKLPDFVLLFYGVFGADQDTASYHQFGGGDFGLGRDAMSHFYALYLDNPQTDKSNPLVSPVLADLTGLPSTHLVVAGLDPLRDDSRLLADRLERAGVTVNITEYGGVIHGFTLMGRHVDAANKALEEAGQRLAAGLE